MIQSDTDQLRVEFEREKWRDELRLRERELVIKEKEQQGHEEDLRLKIQEQARSRWTNPLVIAVLAAAVAAAGNATVAWVTARAQQKADATKAERARDLDESKSEADRILEVIKTNNDPDKAAVNLKFLVEAGLISNPKTKGPLEMYLQKRKDGEGVALPVAAALPTFGPTTPRVTKPTFSIECVFASPPKPSPSEVSISLREFVKEPPFSIEQVEIADENPFQFITWDHAPVSSNRRLQARLAFEFSDLPSTQDPSILIFYDEAKIRVIATFPVHVKGVRVDQNATLSRLTLRMQKIAKQPRCEFMSH